MLSTWKGTDDQLVDALGRTGAFELGVRGSLSSAQCPTCEQISLARRVTQVAPCAAQSAPQSAPVRTSYKPGFVHRSTRQATDGTSVRPNRVMLRRRRQLQRRRRLHRRRWLQRRRPLQRRFLSWRRRRPPRQGGGLTKCAVAAARSWCVGFAGLTGHWTRWRPFLLPAAEGLLGTCLCVWNCLRSCLWSACKGSCAEHSARHLPGGNAIPCGEHRGEEPELSELGG